MREHDDGGFTLIELLIATAILALVIPALANVLIVYFETASRASVRSDRAHDADTLSTWLTRDLASVTRNADVTLNSTAACASPNGMTLQWRQPNPLANGDPGSPTMWTSIYAVVPASSGADGPYVLQRTLSNGVTSSQLTMAHALDTPCSVVTSFPNPGSTVSVQVTPSDPSGRAESGTFTLQGVVGGRS